MIKTTAQDEGGAYSRSKASIPVGSAGRTVARNVARLRKAHGWTLRALSEALAAVGRDLGHDAINKIENGREEGTDKVVRRVDVDDLVAFAAAFNVTPATLLTDPQCAACLDAPPPGYACTTCGTQTPRAQSA